LYLDGWKIEMVNGGCMVTRRRWVIQFIDWKIEMDDWLLDGWKTNVVDGSSLIGRWRWLMAAG
jgi:hypothetical protein